MVVDRAAAETLRPWEDRFESETLSAFNLSSYLIFYSIQVGESSGFLPDRLVSSDWKVSKAFRVMDSIDDVISCEILCWFSERYK
jgi:hypothetical protein